MGRHGRARVDGGGCSAFCTAECGAMKIQLSVARRMEIAGLWCERKEGIEGIEVGEVGRYDMDDCQAFSMEVVKAEA